MAVWTRSVFAVSLTLLAVACGSVPAGATAGAKATSADANTPTVAATSATVPSGGPALLSTSWITATQAWALASQPCNRGTCIEVAHTTDAGQHWEALPTPAASVQDGSVNCSVQTCVSQISFATSQVGYLYGPALLMTTDGGLTWHPVSGPQTETLTIAGGQVYRVTYTNTGCPGPCQPSLEAATVGSSTWRTLVEQLNEPGRSGSAQIVASSEDVLVAMYGSLAGPIPAQAIVYHSADGGGTWRQAADPCDGLG